MNTVRIAKKHRRFLTKDEVKTGNIVTIADDAGKAMIDFFIKSACGDFVRLSDGMVFTFDATLFEVITAQITIICGGVHE